MNKKSAGFGVVEVLIVVAVVAIVGVGGWYVYQMNTKATNNSETMKNADVGQSENDKETTLPEGYVRYENEKIGISFAYPQVWGEVEDKLYTKNEQNTAQGKLYEVNFSKNDNILAAAKTSDHQLSSPRYAFGFHANSLAFDDYQEAIQVHRKNGLVLQETEKYAIVADINCVSGTHYIRALTPFKNSSFVGLTFEYSKDLPAEAAQDCQADASAYVETDKVKQLEQIMETSAAKVD